MRSPPTQRRRVHRVASRLGEDAVWLAIAGLFCVIEGAVRLTELNVPRWLRRRLAAITHTANETAAPVAETSRAIAG